MLFSISISYKNAPAAIREQAVLTKEQQQNFMQQAVQISGITGCMALCTCNRSEVYISGDQQSLFAAQALFARYTCRPLEELLRYYRSYQGEKAILHLYRVAAGLDSKIAGEDEILRQVKDAFSLALHCQTTDYLLNTIVKGAVTCAKRIKTQTLLSKTSVSVGTLTAAAAVQFLPGLKHVFIIGITGQAGTLVMKNLAALKNTEIIGTSRSRNAGKGFTTAADGVKLVAYQDRYQYVDWADVIISATSSPHYTLTAVQTGQAISVQKPRLFIDLAVPADLDRALSQLPGVTIKTLEAIEAQSIANSLQKQKEIEKADFFIRQETDDMMKNLMFHDFLNELEQIKIQYRNQDVTSFIYDLRDSCDYAQACAVLSAMRQLLRKKGGTNP